MAEPPPKRARTAAQEPPSVTPADVAPEAQSGLAAFLARPAAARTPPGKSKAPGPLPKGLAAAAAASLERCWAELPPADASVKPRPDPSRGLTLVTRRLALAHVQVPPETLDEVSRALLAAALAARGAVLPTPEKKTQTPSPLQAPAPAPVPVAAPAPAPSSMPAARLRPTERANARRRAHEQAAAARRRRW